MRRNGGGARPRTLCQEAESHHRCACPSTTRLRVAVPFPETSSGRSLGQQPGVSRRCPTPPALRYRSLRSFKPSIIPRLALLFAPACKQAFATRNFRNRLMQLIHPATALQTTSASGRNRPSRFLRASACKTIFSRRDAESAEKIVCRFPAPGVTIPSALSASLRA